MYVQIYNFVRCLFCIYFKNDCQFCFLLFNRFLVQDHNAMIDVLTLRKQTPLHLAAAAGQLEVCRLLLELGASIDAIDDLGQKPIHVAAQNNFPEVAQLFLQQHPSLVMASTKVCSFGIVIIFVNS